MYHHGHLGESTTMCTVEGLGRPPTPMGFGGGPRPSTIHMLVDAPRCPWSICSLAQLVILVGRSVQTLPSPPQQNCLGVCYTQARHAYIFRVTSIAHVIQVLTTDGTREQSEKLVL